MGYPIIGHSKFIYTFVLCIHVGFFIIFHMLLDDYIAHLVETRLEKDEEQVYFKRIELLKKGII